MNLSIALSTCLTLGLAACASTQTPESVSQPTLIRGAHYVAMGSSFAAGPGVTQTVEGTPPRCARSQDNYARQLARKRGLALTDATCSGATTAHLLGPWKELPPQLDALGPETRLVTVTIGGNDLNWLGEVFAASCQALGLAAALPQYPCRNVQAPSEAAYRQLEQQLSTFASEVHRRAPVARLVFVDYATLLPESGNCAALPLSVPDADVSRVTAARLRQITVDVAGRSGAEVLRASDVTRGHDACAPEPWMNGFTRPSETFSGAPFHPNLAGMTAVAQALDQFLGR